MLAGIVHEVELVPIISVAVVIHAHHDAANDAIVPAGQITGHANAQSGGIAEAHVKAVGQTFLSAGSGDFLVASLLDALSGKRSKDTGQECPVNSQTGMSALRHAGFDSVIMLGKNAARSGS